MAESIWGAAKSHTLKIQRGISLDEVAAMILLGEYADILEHPKRPAQRLFLLSISGYIHVVPFVVDAGGNIVLKTAFPSRKFQKSHGGGNR
jgi:hypothetical protein